MKTKLTYLFLIMLIILLFLNYHIVLTSAIDAFNIWLYKVFPFLFIMFVLNDILISLNFDSLFKSNTIYIIIMSLISGSPSSAYIISEMYNNKKIAYNSANNALLYTYFVNPLFLYSILNTLFIYKIAIKLMIIHYLSNIIIFILYKPKITRKELNSKYININLGNSIKKAMNNLLMILGTIAFFMIITNIINTTLNLNNVTTLFIKGLLEITQGLVYLKSIHLHTLIKQIIAIIFISFGGLSIHSQIKSILDEYNLKYIYFFKGRLLQLIISLILVIAYKT